MNKWMVRLAAIVLVLLFTLVFLNLYRQLKLMEQYRKPAASRPAR